LGSRELPSDGVQAGSRELPSDGVQGGSGTLGRGSGTLQENQVRLQRRTLRRVPPEIEQVAPLGILAREHGM
jgi:hypothetical protein